jgi:hypothetical protein
MRIKSFVVPFVLSLAGLAAARRPHVRRSEGGGLGVTEHNEEKAVVVPGRYIVEFSPVSTRQIKWSPYYECSRNMLASNDRSSR